MPDWERVGRMLRQNDIRAEPVINTIAVVAWFAWAQVVWAIAWEVVVNLPAARHGRPARPAPLTAAPLSGAMARLVAAVVAVGVLSSGTAAVAAGLPTGVARMVPSAVDDSAPPETQSSTVLSPSVQAPPATTWEIERGDTLWDIAEAMLGDGLRVSELLELNPHITSPRTLRTGQLITLPADAKVPDDRQRPTGTDLPAPAHANADGDVPAAAVTVTAGDTLWGIAKAHLEKHGHVGDRTVADYIPAVLAANANTISDPDLIHPGLTVQLPAVDRDPHRIVHDPNPTQDTDTPPETPIVEEVVEEEEDGAAPVPAPIETDDPASDLPTADLTSPVAADVTPSPPETTTESPDTNVGNGATIRAVNADIGAHVDADQIDVFDTTPRTIWWSIPGSLLLAAGITAMIRRLRSRRLARVPPGEQLQPPSDVAAGLELALRSRQANERVNSLQALLASLTPHARATRDMPMVRAVEFDDDRVEILLARPAAITPPGWTTLDGGSSWVHRLDEPMTERSGPSVASALVTLGRRAGGGELLLDLETAGSLTITGDREATLGAARAIAYELATAPMGTMIDVSLIGLEVDGIHHCDRVWSRATLANAAGATDDLAPDDWIIARLGGGDEAARSTDPHVFIIDLDGTNESDIAMTDQLVANCTPGSGRSVVLVGWHEEAAEHLHIESNEMAFWSGAQLEPVIVSGPAVAEVAAALDSVATDDSVPISPPRELCGTDVHDAPAQILTTSPSTNGSQPTPDEAGIRCSYEPPPHDVLVKLLGEVSVVGREITAPMDVEMLALLACMRTVDRRPNIDTIDAMLGRDNAIKTPQSRMSRIRDKLGVASDDLDLLPPAGTTSADPGRYHLSGRVLTDVDLIEHRYHAAQQLPSADAMAVLRDGLDLFAGPPFRGPRAGYGWAYTEGVISRVTNVVNAYASLLMKLAFEADDVPLVLDAVSLRCLRTGGPDRPEPDAQRRERAGRGKLRPDARRIGCRSSSAAGPAHSARGGTARRVGQGPSLSTV